MGHAKAHRDGGERLEGGIQLGPKGVLYEESDEVGRDGVNMRVGDNVGIGCRLVEHCGGVVWLQRHSLLEALSASCISRRTLRMTTLVSCITAHEALLMGAPAAY